jgi:hypothetical protein
VAAALFMPCITAAQTKDDLWVFSVTPYLWLPSISGTLKYAPPLGAGGSPEIGIGPSDYLSTLQFAMMISGEVRKSRWLVFTDVIYLNFHSEKSDVKAVNFG